MTQAAVQPAEKEATTSTRKVPVPPREWIDTERLLKARPQLRRAVLGLRGLLESQERSQAAGATAWMTAADYRFLGRGWVSLREWERAARAHEQATQLQPTGGDFFRIAYAHDEMAQSSGKPIPLLEKTVAAYQEALKHYTPQAAPLDYAATQNNLGAAYRDLAAHRDAQKNLERTIAAWTASLVIRGRGAPGRARNPARSLATTRTKVGAERFRQLVESALQQPDLAFLKATAEEALALVDRFGKEEGPGGTDSSRSLP